MSPQIDEANYIAMALEKEVEFTVIQMKFDGQPRLVVRVDNRDALQTYLWNIDKF